LMNRIRKAAVLCESNLIWASDLDLLANNLGKHTAAGNLAQTRNLAEKVAVIDTFVANKQNVSKTAKQLGVSRMTLYRLLDKHDITSVDSLRSSA